MDSTATTAVVGSVDLFHDLKPKVLKQVVAAGSEARFGASEAVLSQGEEVGGFKAFSPQGVKMHVVLEGTASVHIDGVAVAELGPGAYFGELSVIDGEPRSADVVAGASGLTTLAISNWSFLELLEQHPEVAVPMLKVLCARLRRAEADARRD